MSEKIDLHKPPYYVRENYQDYSCLLFQPGMHLQNSELNELQLTQKDSLKGIADVFLTDGDRIFGMEVLIEEDVVIVTAGEIYLNGKVHVFKEQNVRISKKGREEIGVRLRQEVVDHTDDPGLVSPAASHENYSLPGAARLREYVELVLNDPKATVINTFQDGLLQLKSKEEQETFIQRLREELARRTYDQSGNYKVYGLSLSQKAQYDTDFLYLTLSEGKAYIEGWEVEKPTAVSIPIRRSTKTRTITAEPKQKTSTDQKFKLNNHPADRINEVRGEVRVKTQLTRQGAVDGSDPIPSRFTPVVTVESVQQTGASTTFRNGTDFVLEGDSIRWLNGGNQPDLGQTYDITFIYNKVLVPDEDYKMTVENEEYYLELLDEGDIPVDNKQIQVDYDFFLHYQAFITLDKDGNIRVVEGQPNTYIDITSPDITNQKVLVLGSVIVTPKSDTLEIVNSKTERSSMDRIQRMFDRMEEMELNQAITNLDEEAMAGEDPTNLKGIFTDGFLGFSKADVNHKEFNAAIDVSDRALTSGMTEDVREITINPNKEIDYDLSDSLVTAKSNVQPTLEQRHATESHVINPYTYASNQVYKLTLLPHKEAIVMTEPEKQATVGQLVKVNVNITEKYREFDYIMVNQQKITGDSFKMPAEDVVIALFLKDTTPIEPKKHNISLIPGEEFRISTTPANEAKAGEIVTVHTNILNEEREVNQVLVNSKAIDGNSFVMPDHHVTVTVTLRIAPPKDNPYIKITPQSDNWIDSERITVREQGKTTTRHRTATSTISATFWSPSQPTSRTSRSSDQILANSYETIIDSAIEYMRVREIKFTASKFNRNQDNILVTFNNQIISPTPSGDTKRGTLGNSLQANNRGEIQGSFMIPAGTKTGTVRVSTYTADFPEFVGSTAFTSSGIKRLFKTTEVYDTRVTIHTTRSLPRSILDPIAQTFEYGEDTLLDSLGLYFGKVDKEYPITLQIREVENGYPSTNILLEQVLDLEKITTSENSSEETVIKLEDPVYCEANKQYAFSILTHSDKSALYVQELGKRDLITKETILTNPYVDGMMFGSSNALAWTPYQTKNIKFNLYSRRFKQKSVIYFNTISGLDADAIALLVDTSVPLDCDLQWEYSSDGEKTWQPFSSWRQTSLSKSIQEFTLRCTLLAKENISPAINVESMLLRATKNKEVSSYISRNVQTDIAFSNVRIVADVYTPSGTGVVFYYATDIDGKVWKPLRQEKDPKVKQVGGYAEHYYTAEETSTSFKNFRVKVALTTNNTTVTPRVKSLKCILK